MTNNPTELAAEICGALKAIDDMCPYEDSMGARACDRHAVIIRSLLTELGAARDALEIVKWNPTQSCLADVDEALTRLTPLLDALKG